jgi:hypothetical protein
MNQKEWDAWWLGAMAGFVQGYVLFFFLLAVGWL